MPNHVHGIICLIDRTSIVGARHAVPLLPGQRFGRPIAGSIPTIVRSFKSATTRGINQLRGTPGGALWQRGHLERVIRDDAEMHRIRRYIVENPLRRGTHRDEG